MGKQLFRLSIKYLKTHCCKLIVVKILGEMNIPFAMVGPGFAQLLGPVSAAQKQKLKRRLKECHLDLVEDHKEAIVEQLYCVVHFAIHDAEEWPKIKFSEHLNRLIGYDYTYISNVFKAFTGGTVQEYVIGQKIKFSLELISYGGLSLSQIAFRLGYTDLAHFSKQFKKIMGYNPSDHKAGEQNSSAHENQ
jgi:AraC-like DNA-binding protein